MESPGKFDLEKSVNDWGNELLSTQAFTNADIEELKSHLLDLYYDLQEQNLSKEEAFLVAVTRLGRSTDWSSEFEQANQKIIDLKKAVLIVIGILYYFLSYYAIRVFLAIVLLVNIIIVKESIYAVKNIKYAIIILLSVVGSFIFVLFKRGSSVIDEFKNVKISAKKIITTFLITTGLAIANHCMLPFIHQLIPETWLRAQYANTINYFSYAYPFLILLGLLIFHIKYLKITDFPQD